MERCNPEGCKKVAGGRSEAKTTGWGTHGRPHPDGVPEEKGLEILAPLRGATFFSTCSGGFHFASTTGYWLATLRVAAVWPPGW